VALCHRCEAAADGHAKAAIDTLGRILDSLPACFVGWIIPIEPAFHDLRQEPAFQALASRLAERAK